VEAVLEGDHDAVEELITFCRSGPEDAAVENVEVGEEEPAGEQGFQVR
jgi:acylphosphatase